LLRATGWQLQNNSSIDFNAGPGIAYQIDAGSAGYTLFTYKQAVGFSEAKSESWGHKITMVKD
jgi:hypothetical protein